MRAAVWLRLGAASVIMSGARGVSESITVTEDAGIATQTYMSDATTITLDVSSGTTNTSSSTGSSSSSSTSYAGTLLIGTLTSNASNATASATSSSLPSMTNTQPCNGYPELCNRNYSNITFVAAHNSPFAIKNNAASNQLYPVIAQLNDGIRMLQGQTHIRNGVVHYCHTSCDLLDAGPAVDYFQNVTDWLMVPANRFEVVTILIGNGDYVAVGNFTQPLVDSGLATFAYLPPKIPMALDDWPTLGELILNNTRAIIFMDYDANQTQVPYILDEFSQMWETPFNPLNNTFPCVVNRPPDLAAAAAKDRLYLLNNNLNVQVDLFGAQILVPNTVAINTTNALSGAGSLGLSTNNCRSDWDRPPNFLLVDYYNYGSFPGSVFEVAARANNLTYIPKECCGLDNTVSLGVALHVSSLALFLALWTAVMLV